MLPAPESVCCVDLGLVIRLEFMRRIAQPKVHSVLRIISFHWRYLRRGLGYSGSMSRRLYIGTEATETRFNDACEVSFPTIKRRRWSSETDQCCTDSALDVQAYLGTVQRK